MRRFAVSLVLLAVACFAAFPMLLGAQAAQAQSARSIAQIVLRSWNGVGNKIITMAEDWPEAKYNYRPNAGVRTFQQVLLHVAGDNYNMLNRAAGKTLGHAANDPTGPQYKTKAQTVAFLKKSVADGAAEIQREGDAGVLKNIGSWMGDTEHMGEHYGQLVVYYRNNRVVPPSSRPRK
ncbi:MAG TPA: DinB family protein [Candidatus Acidoferrales bacterium]|nr:DinB family protein [Candidatus Acidoferrales bacterium]